MTLTETDQKLLNLVLEAGSKCSLCEECRSEEDRHNFISRIRRAPIRRARLLARVKEDLEKANISVVGEVDWEAIKEFLKEYGPTILRIILALFAI